MKRAALLLSLAVLGAGCYSSPSNGSVTFYWQFQNNAAQTVGDFTATNPGCGQAGIEPVDGIAVTIDNQTTPYNCTGSNGVPGVTITNFTPGTYAFTVVAFRSGEQAFSFTGNVVVHSDTDSPIFVTLAPDSPTSLVVYYTINGVQSCGGISAIHYSLTDLSGTPIAGASADVACDPNSFGFVIPSLPLGTYRFSYIQALDTNGFAVSQVCHDTVPHDGFPVDVTLTPPAPGTCL